MDSVVFKEPVLPPLLLLANTGGLGLGGGVDLPKECFLGELEAAAAAKAAAFSFNLTTGKDAGCFSSFLGMIFLLPPILSVLPLSFSLLELAELDSSREDFLLIFVEGCCGGSLAPADGGRLGFLVEGVLAFKKSNNQAL